MSKSITEKELAEKLKTWHGRNWEQPDWYWRDLARASAEATGYEFAPEKPEPGTWHVVLDGPYVNRKAHVNGYNGLMIFADNGDYDTLLADANWPALAPARVAPAEPGELSEGEVKESANVEWAAYRKDYGPLPSDMELGHKAFHAGYRAALAKHGHGRAEVEREWLRAGIAELRGNGYGLNGEVIDIITDAIMELLEASK